ncbi:MAG TPA: hypothetical protein VE960_06225 [bacterium]|nr:hypothetical protein [bacterium]
MREIISETPPRESRLLTGAFVVLALALIWVAFAFTLEVFGAANPVVLGVNLASGFAILGLMTIAYYRLFVPHRMVLEQDEDLW